jgi:hypothetical protein
MKPESTVSGQRRSIEPKDAKSRDGRGHIGKESPNEIVEPPNESSLLGLRPPPKLIPHEVEIIDARNRGAIATRLLNLLGLILIIITGAVVAATFAHVSATALIAYAKWVVGALISLFTMALGYFFGATQRSRSRNH